MLRGIGRLRAGYGTDLDAGAWGTAVIAAGGTYSGSTLNAVSRFCRISKSAGLWDKITRINLICGSDLVAARVPLKAGGGSATETVSLIVGGDYVETGSTGGIKGNGSNKSFSTGWNPVSRGASSSSFGVWAYVSGTESAGTSRAILGAQDAASNHTLISWGLAGTAEIGAIATAATSEFAPAGTPAGKQGFLGIATNGSRAQQYYHNGATVGAPVTATGSFANQPIFCLAANAAGAGASFSTRYLRAYAITTGITSAEAAAFDAVMQDFQAALGRNV